MDRKYQVTLSVTEEYLSYDPHIAYPLDEALARDDAPFAFVEFVGEDGIMRLHRTREAAHYVFADSSAEAERRVLASIAGHFVRACVTGAHAIGMTATVRFRMCFNIPDEIRSRWLRRVVKSGGEILDEEMGDGMSTFRVIQTERLTLPLQDVRSATKDALERLRQLYPEAGNVAVTQIVEAPLC